MVSNDKINMIKQINNKVKNLLGYTAPQAEKAEVTMETSSQEESIKKENDSKTFTCDCCGESSVTIEISELFKLDNEGNKIPLYSHPKVNTTNGSIYDDVVICEQCYSMCQTDAQKRYVWIAGKINQLQKEISDKETMKSENNALIENIKLEAEKQINDVLENSNVLSAEIMNIATTIQHLQQEQLNLEKAL